LRWAQRAATSRYQRREKHAEISLEKRLPRRSDARTDPVVAIAPATVRAGVDGLSSRIAGFDPFLASASKRNVGEVARRPQ